MARNVVTVGPEASVAEAAELMAQHDVSALPVVDAHNQLVGIISEATSSGGRKSARSPTIPGGSKR